MTVAQLIDHLRAFPANMPVVVAGFDEMGFDDPEPPHIIKCVDAGDGYLSRYGHAQAMHRVLVVEDDAVQREAVGKLLTSHDVETVATGTAAECLELLKQQGPAELVSLRVAARQDARSTDGGERRLRGGRRSRSAVDVSRGDVDTPPRQK
jgi:hypothetical protein